LGSRQRGYVWWFLPDVAHLDTSRGSHRLRVTPFFFNKNLTHLRPMATVVHGGDNAGGPIVWVINCERERENERAETSRHHASRGRNGQSQGTHTEGPHTVDPQRTQRNCARKTSIPRGALCVLPESVSLLLLTIKKKKKRFDRPHAHRCACAASRRRVAAPLRKHDGHGRPDRRLIADAQPEEFPSQRVGRALGRRRHSG